MSKIDHIEKKRLAVLEQMKAIRFMKRGTISEQFVKAKHKSPKQDPLGPYYVFSRRINQKTVSQRLKTAEEIRVAKQGIEAYSVFTTLRKEYERLTEQLGELELGLHDETQEKKRQKASSKKTRK